MAGKPNRGGLEITLPSDREILMTRIEPGKRLVHTETYEMFPDAESLITSKLEELLPSLM